jgi:hypothetical protein
MTSILVLLQEAVVVAISDVILSDRNSSKHYILISVIWKECQKYLGGGQERPF